MISTRGRYALRVLIDLAEQDTSIYTPIRAVAERQEISVKYLEQIMPILMRAGLVDGMAGKGGGYRLNRPPEEYVVGQVLRLTEGGLAPVACLGCRVNNCNRSSFCKTLPMWQQYYDQTVAFFDGITIADLMNGRILSPPSEK